MYSLRTKASLPVRPLSFSLLKKKKLNSDLTSTSRAVYHPSSAISTARISSYTPQSLLVHISRCPLIQTCWPGPSLQLVGFCGVFFLHTFVAMVREVPDKNRIYIIREFLFFFLFFIILKDSRFHFHPNPLPNVGASTI